MAKDGFGYGTKINIEDQSNLQNHLNRSVIDELGISLISEFMPHIDEKTTLEFLKGNLEDKIRILHNNANDTDDRLWRSKEWEAIVSMQGGYEEQVKGQKRYWEKR